MSSQNIPSALSDLSGKSAVVTGASSGIGRAIAVALATAGADVAVHARSNQIGAEEVATMIQDLGRNSFVTLADLAAPNTHAELVERCWTGFKKIDIWVNNAGGDVLTGARAKVSFEEKLRYLWRTDVEATIQLSRLVGMRMKQHFQGAASASGGNGVILNMGWDQAWIGMAGDSGEMFSAIKGAVMAFSKSLAKSLAPEVRVNCLAPGWIRTAWGAEASEYWRARAQRESLLGRWGQPEDVAQVACFLASDAAKFINGEIIPINGGFAGSYQP